MDKSESDLLLGKDGMSSILQLDFNME